MNAPDFEKAETESLRELISRPWGITFVDRQTGQTKQSSVSGYVADYYVFGGREFAELLESIGGEPTGEQRIAVTVECFFPGINERYHQEVMDKTVEMLREVGIDPADPDISMFAFFRLKGHGILLDVVVPEVEASLRKDFEGALGQAQKVFEEKNQIAQREALEQLVADIGAGKAPEVITRVLKAIDWATPAEKRRFGEQLEQGRKEMDKLVLEKTKSVDDLSGAQERLASLGIRLAEEKQAASELGNKLELAGYEKTALVTQIEALRTAANIATGESSTQQTKPKDKIDKPSVEELKDDFQQDERLKNQYRVFCDDKFAGFSEATGSLRRKGGLSNQSRIETQTTFLDRDKTDLNPRFGMFRVANSLFGRPVSALGDPAQVGEALLKEDSPQLAQEIGGAIELLAKGETCRVLTEQLVKGLVGARTYYDFSTVTETFFVGALPDISSAKNFKKDKFFMNVPLLISAMQRIDETLGSSVLGGPKNALLTELKEAFARVSNGALTKDLQALVQTSPDIFKADYNQDLEVPQIGGQKASDLLISVFRKNKVDCDCLSIACQRLSTVLVLASYHREMTSRVPVETEHVVPSGDRLVLEDGRNPYAILLSAAVGGRYLGSEDSDWYRWFSLFETIDWPPETRYSDSLTKAIENEQPISLSIDPSRPIILLTGNNGAGKTRAMETIAQTVAHALVSGTDCTARILRLPKIGEVRSLVGAARHTAELSSFQREALLLKDAIGTLLMRPKNEKAILVVDEVGKGTDSRDAIALMTAVAEYCRRNDVYLLMATHHGRDFVKLANKLGLRESMTILSPDFATHRLHQYEQPVSSKGVEVMRARAEKNKIPDSVASTVFDNADKIRQSVLEDSVPNLEKTKFEKVAARGPFVFVDEETLGDIGLGYDRKKRDVLQGTKPLCGMARKASGVGFSWRSESAWNDAFLQRWGEVTKLEEKAVESEHGLINALVQFSLSSPGDKSEFVKASAGAFNTARVLFAPIPPNKLQEMCDRYDRCVEGDISHFLSFGEGEKEVLEEFFSSFGDKDRRTKAFEATFSFGQSLVASRSEPLVRLGYRVISFAKMGEKLNDIMAEAGVRAEEQFVTHMRQQAAESIKKRLPDSYSYKCLSDSDAVALADQLGESVLTNARVFFENVATRIESGDQQVYASFVRWLIDGQDKRKPLYAETAQDYLYRDAKLKKLSEMADEIEKNHKPIVKNGLPPGVEADADFRSVVMNSFVSGDVAPLFSLIRIAKKSGAYFDYDRSGEIARMAENLNLGRFFAWQKFVSEQSSHTEDLYAILGVSEVATEAEVREAARKITKGTHPDVATPIGWRGRNIAEAPEDIRQKVEEAREVYEKAVSAQRVLMDENQRSLYDRNRNVRALLDMAYYGTVVNAINELDWCEVSYSDDGSLDLRNSLAVGLLGSMDKSKIVRQSLTISPQTESVVIGGSNGNGKSHLLIQLASAFEWARTTGYVPAEHAVLPKVKFISCMVNAGESTEGKSSFQNESDRYLNLLNQYVNSGCPTDGIIFFDEPLAGTSSEDQIGILLSVVDFFRQRNVKVVFTNHNYRTYEFMRRTGIKFKPVAFLAGKGREKFQLTEFNSSDTEAIRSDGIKVAGELGFPWVLGQIALFARNVLTGSTSIEE